MADAETCAYCGGELTRRRREAGSCAECERVALAAACVPRAWQADFDMRALFVLLGARLFTPDGWVRITRIMPCTADDAAGAVRKLRRMGFVVEGRAGRGYRLLRNDHASVHAEAAE